MATVNELLLDSAMPHALAVARYDKGLSDAIVRLLNSADTDLVGRIAARLAQIEERGTDLGPRVTARLIALLDELRAINASVYSAIEDRLTDELTEFASLEAAFQTAAVDAALGVQLGMNLPSPARLRAIVIESPIDGFLLKSWVDGMSDGRMRRVEQQIRLGMVAGDTTDAIVRRIRGTRANGYTDGVLGISRKSAQTLVRTAVSHVSNAAAQDTWKANSGVVKGWQFLATFDDRTTVTCAGLSGQVFPIGEGPIPPRHPRCRSTSVPVLRSFRDLGIDRDELPEGTRATMDGQAAASTTFSKWLKGKGEATQDKMLGKTRADLFRSGKLDLKQLIASDGTMLTLDQLRAVYPRLLDK